MRELHLALHQFLFCFLNVEIIVFEARESKVELVQALLS